MTHVISNKGSYKNYIIANRGGGGYFQLYSIHRGGSANDHSTLRFWRDYTDFTKFNFFIMHVNFVKNHFLGIYYIGGRVQND